MRLLLMPIFLLTLDELGSIALFLALAGGSMHSLLLDNDRLRLAALSAGRPLVIVARR
jgi:hypothetical protein